MQPLEAESACEPDRLGRKSVPRTRNAPRASDRGNNTAVLFHELGQPPRNAPRVEAPGACSPYPAGRSRRADLEEGLIWKHKSAIAQLEQAAAEAERS